ncbi:phytanoyl-CoA dioxygenase family protein [Sporosarcina sp. E16_3]|uniref:phytanoyl-CoA dioxygenase family protein n=1 Tax=Sporosarcina sp. E16_3 TaxID=2789293 RepID=UPI001A92DE0A|nr:phytanoyl-CoA dioxygenase family protein [Sporosarcina sp. E16_3]MBO0603310.1 phytanoyl-CoA dioxygenase family protein [Sporosarcina sp. E16_3]
MIKTQVLPTKEDVAFFEENGYWVAPKIISDERLELLRERMESIYDGKYESGKEPFSNWKKEDGPGLRKSDNVHWADHVYRELATDEMIGSIAAELMKSNAIRLWHDQLLYKPGQLGTKTANVGWHQDYTYWQCADKPSLLTAWVAFDDVDLSNGCMQVVPRSNQWGLLNENNFFEQDMKSQEKNMNIPDGETFKQVPLVMKAGQVSFHHALTLHGSGPNNTDKPRRSIAIHMMTADTCYKKGEFSDGHMNVSLLNGQDGDLFAGEYFPIMFQHKGKECSCSPCIEGYC